MTRAPTLGGRRRQSSVGTRRVATHSRYRLPGDFHCECGLPSCRGTIPADAEPYRAFGNVVVVPDHYGGQGTVVRAADSFFVVASR